ncbi:hypothetical protein [Cohnella sp. CFH 77786]
MTGTLASLEDCVNKLGKFGDSTTLIVMSSPIVNKPVIPSLAQ